MRLFFGVELPDRLRPVVAHAQSLLRSAGADVRWVRPELAHITLLFVGEVSADALPCASAAARRVAGAEPAASSAALLRLHGLGRFPEGGAMRVVWLGVADDIEPLARLHRDLRSELARHVHDQDRLPYRPHVTIGRLRQRRNGARQGHGGSDGLGRQPAAGELALSRMLAQHDRIESDPWRVARFTLFESRLKPGGPRYEPIGRYHLPV